MKILKEKYGDLKVIAVQIEDSLQRQCDFFLCRGDNKCKAKQYIWTFTSKTTRKLLILISREGIDDLYNIILIKL